MPELLSHNQSIAQIIATVRVACHANTRDFAAALDVSHNTVSQWERGIAGSHLFIALS